MSEKAKGRTIRVFLAEGTATGVLTAEIMNWTGHVLCAPRAKLVEMLQRSESGRTGVYLLTGKDNTGSTQVYVGESDNVATRLKQHNQNEDKEFWEYSCLITSKDQNLTKAHVKYLESRLIEIIQHEGRADLRNSTSPSYENLPEPDVADMEYFVAQLLVLLPTLGFEFIRPTPNLSNQAQPARTPVGAQPIQVPIPTGGFNSRQAPLRDRPTADGGASPEFKMVAGGLTARAMEVDGQMIVLAGSESREMVSESLGANVRQYRSQLMTSGKLVPSGKAGILVFRDDVAFTSPSAAAQAIMGTSRNGRTDWANTATGQTYAAWQEAQLAESGIREAD